MDPLEKFDGDYKDEDKAEKTYGKLADMKLKMHELPEKSGYDAAIDGVKKKAQKTPFVAGFKFGSKIRSEREK